MFTRDHQIADNLHSNGVSRSNGVLLIQSIEFPRIIEISFQIGREQQNENEYSWTPLVVMSGLPAATAAAAAVRTESSSSVNRLLATINDDIGFRSVRQ